MNYITGRTLPFNPWMQAREIGENDMPIGDFDMIPALAARPTTMRVSGNQGQMSVLSPFARADHFGIGHPATTVPTQGIRVLAPRDAFLLYGGSAAQAPRLFERRGPAYLLAEINDAPSGHYLVAGFDPKARIMVASMSGNASQAKLFTRDYRGLIYDRDVGTAPFQIDRILFTEDGLHVMLIGASSCEVLRTDDMTPVTEFPEGIPIGIEGGWYVMKDGDDISLWEYDEGEWSKLADFLDPPLNVAKALIAPDRRNIVLSGNVLMDYGIAPEDEESEDEEGPEGPMELEGEQVGELSSSNPSNAVISPDGEYIAGEMASNMILYEREHIKEDDRFDEIDTIPPMSGISSVKFSPDGTKVAVRRPTSPQISIYDFDGESLTPISGSPATSGNGDVSWSYDGTMLVSGINIYSVSPSSYSFVGQIPSPPFSPTPIFHPTQDILLIVTPDVPRFRFYSRSGNTLTPIASPITQPSESVQWAKYSKSGDFFSYYTPTGGLAVYKTGSTSYDLMELPEIEGGSRGVVGVDFSRNDRYFITSAFRAIEGEDERVFYYLYEVNEDGPFQLIHEGRLEGGGGWYPEFNPKEDVFLLDLRNTSPYVFSGRIVNGVVRSIDELPTIPPLSGSEVRSFNYSADGKTLIVHSGTDVGFYNFESEVDYKKYEPLTILNPTPLTIDTFSPDSSMIHMESLHKTVPGNAVLGQLPFDAAAPSTIDQVEYGFKGGRSVAYRKSGTQTVSVKRSRDEGYVLAGAINGNILTLYRREDYELIEEDYILLPTNIRARDLTYSSTGKMFSYFHEDIGRVLYETIDFEYNHRGTVFDSGMIDSRIAFSPLEHFFAATYRYSDGAMNHIRLYDVITDPPEEWDEDEHFAYEFEEVDRDSTQYGPVDISPCDDILVAHGLLPTPFTLYLTNRPDLVLNLIEFPVVDWEDFGYIFDVKFGEDCDEIFVLTEDGGIIVIDRDEDGGKVENQVPIVVENPGTEDQSPGPESRITIPVPGGGGGGGGGGGRTRTNWQGGGGFGGGPRYPWRRNPTWPSYGGGGGGGNVGGGGGGGGSINPRTGKDYTYFAFAATHVTYRDQIS